MDYAKESLRLHNEWKGKIEVIATVPVASKEDLSLAYTPGVAEPCLEIQRFPEKSYTLTRRHNLCAVITDGSAVLGLGDIGPEAGMPVMEGKELSALGLYITALAGHVKYGAGFPHAFVRSLTLAACLRT